MRIAISLTRARACTAVLLSHHSGSSTSHTFSHALILLCHFVRSALSSSFDLRLARLSNNRRLELSSLPTTFSTSVPGGRVSASARRCSSSAVMRSAIWRLLLQASADSARLGNNHAKMVSPLCERFCLLSGICGAVIDAGNTAPVPIDMAEHGLDHMGHDANLVVHRC